MMDTDGDGDKKRPFSMTPQSEVEEKALKKHIDYEYKMSSARSEKRIEYELEYEKKYNEKRLKEIKKEYKEFIGHYIEVEVNGKIAGCLKGIEWDRSGYFLKFKEKLSTSYIEDSETGRQIENYFLQKNLTKTYISFDGKLDFNYTTKESLENFCKKRNNESKEEALKGYMDHIQRLHKLGYRKPSPFLEVLQRGDNSKKQSN